MLAPWKKSYEQPRQHINKQSHYFANKGPSSQSYGFSSSHIWMWVLDYKERWVPKNWCFWTVVLEKTLESPLDCKEIKLVNSKGNQPWIFIGGTWCWGWNSNNLATWCEEPTHWKRSWCWERLSAGGEGDDREWDGWMASPTQWRWVRAGSGNWWWTGKPGVLQSLVLQRVRHDWTTEQHQMETKIMEAHANKQRCWNESCVHAQSLVVCNSLQPPGTVALQTSLSMGFSKQEYCSGYPFPPPGDRPNPELNMHLLHWQVASLPLSQLESPIKLKGRQVNLVFI